MAIQLGGLATGLDTNGLIQQLLAMERRPITMLETRKLKYQALSTAFQDLNTRLSTLKTKADALRTPETFFARSVTSSDETVATATATPGTVQGTYALTVTGLAKGSIAAAANTKSSTSDTVAAADGTFEFRLGAAGSLVSVDVTTTTTLEGLVTAINDENAGVRASLVNAGTAETPAWKLTLTSTATGSANNIVIVTDPTTLGIANTQAATDAAFTITGLGNFTRSTNTFSDVFDGVTITLKSLASTDLSVSYDRSATQSRVLTLIEGYNDVIRAIDSQSVVTKGSDGKVTAGPFNGDAATRGIRRTLASAVATNVGGSIAALADIGVTTKSDGTLTLDVSKFQAAFERDPAAMQALVAGTASRDGIADLLYTAADDATRAVTGTIAARRDGITNTIRSIQSQIAGAEVRLATSERALRARFEALEVTVSRLQSTGASLLSQLQRLDSGR